MSSCCLQVGPNIHIPHRFTVMHNNHTINQAAELTVCKQSLHAELNIQQLATTTSGNWQQQHNDLPQMLTTDSLAAGAPCCSKPRTADHSCGTTAAVAEAAAVLLAVVVAVTMAVSSCSICTVGARVSTCISASHQIVLAITHQHIPAFQYMSPIKTPRAFHRSSCLHRLDTAHHARMTNTR